ncbi:uncharacterized protein HD556DRAFT_1317615 [Suillus plorans]|uniref:F-box domain-containing protein n=1 Tax=Suillus plorans TaxID=116603 RepID=A0A9P7E342_9AGAM|nr:uncharacterized protein HD556DRAFT_1317615 [Suillus plorans]KAG1810055.1 hypothetical protein HD556DRAFT_1317615 [Suillus plorans]
MAATPTTLSCVFQIPPELTEHTLTLCHPRDVESFSQTCRKARRLVYGSPDQYLWRQLFLLFPFDDPRLISSPFQEDGQFNWRKELHRRMEAQLIACRTSSTLEDLLKAIETFISVVQSAAPVTWGHERVPSPNLLWVVEVLQSTNMLRYLPLLFSEEGNQSLARLRAYLALTLDEYDDDDVEGKERLKSIRTRSRCQVYDLRNYHQDNDWGPFNIIAGEVDWTHIESIINVVSMNLSDRLNDWPDTRPRYGLEATRAYSAPGTTSLATGDWAGIEGHWRRYVCFMDYRDLFAFNYGNRGHGQRDGTYFDTPHFEEAMRLIELKLTLIDSQTIPEVYTLDRFPDSPYTHYPTLYFTGSSWGIKGNEATVVGSVTMSEGGVVRWRFASIADSHIQWSSEGVQIGGIASAFGVIGTWTGVHHDHGDPVGPFWLYKVEDDHPIYMRTLVNN